MSTCTRKLTASEMTRPKVRRLEPRIWLAAEEVSVLMACPWRCSWRAHGVLMAALIETPCAPERHLSGASGYAIRRRPALVVRNLPAAVDGPRRLSAPPPTVGA